LFLMTLVHSFPPFATLFAAPRKAALLLLSLAVACPFAAAQQHKTWKDYGSGPDSSKFLDLDQITKSNVKDLKVAWTAPTNDKSTYAFNPIIVDNVMYALARNNSLVALDATTGKEIWIHENLRGIAPRGINYWESKDRKDRRLIFQINNRLQAIDAHTGKSILTFGKNGLVDLREGLGRDPNTLSRAQSGSGRVRDEGDGRGGRSTRASRRGPAGQRGRRDGWRPGRQGGGWRGWQSS
jgi:quinoprotein glucose dehydrogenase